MRESSQWTLVPVALELEFNPLPSALHEQTFTSSAAHRPSALMEIRKTNQSQQPHQPPRSSPQQITPPTPLRWHLQPPWTLMPARCLWTLRSLTRVATGCKLIAISEELPKGRISHNHPQPCHGSSASSAQQYLTLYAILARTIHHFLLLTPIPAVVFTLSYLCHVLLFATFVSCVIVLNLALFQATSLRYVFIHCTHCTLVFIHLYLMFLICAFTLFSVITLSRVMIIAFIATLCLCLLCLSLPAQHNPTPL